jgi:hypothetical protein
MIRSPLVHLAKQNMYRKFMNSALLLYIYGMLNNSMLSTLLGTGTHVQYFFLFYLLLLSVADPNQCPVRSASILFTRAGTGSELKIDIIFQFTL